MTKRKVLIIVIILIIIIAAFYFTFLKEEKPEYSLVKVVRGDILQEVSETGNVTMGEEINLSFKDSGRIKNIYIEVGDKVKMAQSLAGLDMTQLSIQLTEAQAALEVSQAKLNQLLAGSTPEEIQIAETSVLNVQTSLDDAKQSLGDTGATTKENIDSDYEDALNILDDSYLKAYNASNKVDLIQRTYFEASDQESINIKERRASISYNLDQIKNYLDIVENNPSNKNTDEALVKFQDYLSDIYDDLSEIRDKTETLSYRNAVSSSDKTALDTHKTNINTALTNLVNSQQAISSTKLTNTADINTAKAKVTLAEGDLKAAKDELALIKADPSQEDIDLHQAQIRQAQANVDLLRNQIKEAVLISPTDGQIVEVKKRVGEIIQSTETVISLIPSAPFQIEVDIYEEDVVRVKVDNPAGITLTAFPEKVFDGRVISIDPAEKVIEGVVYYEVTIDFEEIPQNIKPGMTADIFIKTASRENVLVIPEDAIEKKDSKTVIQLLKGEIIKEREVEIGLQGSDGMVEVVSGLEAGEEVVIE